MSIPTPSPEIVTTLIERIKQLEARLERVEALTSARRAHDVEPSMAPGRAHGDELMMKFRASLDFDRQRRLEELRANPGLLAAIRARRAAINAFYVSRGLTPDPDPYPELA